MDPVFAVDLLGTFAFSVTGIIGGIRHDINWIGAFSLAFVAAMAGGIIRDAILGLPSSTFQNPTYLFIVLIGVIFTYLFIDKVQQKYEFFICLDAVGLAIFTIIGVNKAMALGTSCLGSIILGMITATGGGAIRDVLLGDLPLIFHRGAYAMPSIFGGTLFYIIFQFHFLPLSVNIILSGTAIFLFRMWSYRRNLHTPRFYRKRLLKPGNIFDLSQASQDLNYDRSEP